MRAYNSKQRGGASLLTTVILAVVLLGIVGGLTTLSVRELRQASNTEQSNRALSGAESYVQTLATQIANSPTGALPASACPTNVKLGDNLAVTCAVVTAGNVDNLSGSLERDASFKVDLSTASEKPAKMTVEWSKSNDDPVPTDAKCGSFKSLASGNWSCPAAPELTMVWYGGSITPSNDTDYGGLPMSRAVARPAGALQFTGSAGSLKTNPVTVGTTCKAGNSIATDSYRCSTGQIDLASIYSGNSASNLVFKITSRYNKTSFRLKFYKADGTTLITVPAPYATIDVTTKSNNLYRRVIAQKDLDSSNVAGFLDYTVFSGGNICKDLKVGADHNPVNGGTGKNTCDGKN